MGTSQHFAIHGYLSLLIKLRNLTIRFTTVEIIVIATELEMSRQKYAGFSVFWNSKKISIQYRQSNRVMSAVIVILLTRLFTLSN